jgi:hypothetical protein
MIILSLNLISCCVSWCATSLGYCPALLYALNLQLNDGEQVTSCSLSTHSCLLSSLSCSQSPSLLIFIEHHLLAVNRKTGRTVQTQDLNLLYIRCIPKIFCFFCFWGIFLFSFVQYSALLHLPPLKYHCADGCWDRTQDRCIWCISSQTL